MQRCDSNSVLHSSVEGGGITALHNKRTPVWSQVDEMSLLFLSVLAPPSESCVSFGATVSEREGSHRSRHFAGLCSVLERAGEFMTTLSKPNPKMIPHTSVHHLCREPTKERRVSDFCNVFLLFLVCLGNFGKALLRHT